jgi:endonuclease/exonuclease/phosphatase family metal-dependent hydrolase
MRWASLALAALAALVWMFLGPRLRERDGAHPPARGEALRVVTWNLANFEGDPRDHDLERIAEVVEQLDPDIVAFEEIKDPEALAGVLPDFELRFSEGGGRGHQRLGFAWRPERAELVETSEHRELSFSGRVRPAFAAYFTGLEGGPDLWLVAVHLKAMPEGIELRRQQWPELLAVSEAKRAGAHGDEDLIVLGDFNTTGRRRGGEAVERAELAATLERGGLRRIPNATGCTAYYDGARRDAWKEPSEIDLVWVRGLAESLDAEARVHSGTHCAAQRCRDFRSTKAYPLRDYAFVSDHCPVVLDLARADDD